MSYEKNYWIMLVVLLGLGLGAGPAAAGTFTTIDYPSGTGGTYACDISGGNIVGYNYTLFSPDSYLGFLYNGSTYTTVTYPPEGIENFATAPCGISGNNIVGYFQVPDSYQFGFLDNGSTYSTLNDPLGKNGTWVTGIHGSNIVGYYKDSAGNFHGFETSVPEPSTFLLLAVGSVSLLVYSWWRRRRVRGGQDRKCNGLTHFIWFDKRPVYVPACLYVVSVIWPNLFPVCRRGAAHLLVRSRLTPPSRRIIIQAVVQSTFRSNRSLP